MSDETDFERLMAKARNCRNNARAEQLVVDAFRDEYVAGLSSEMKDLPADEAALRYRHTRETYDFYVGGQRRAREYLADAELFERAAACLIGSGDVNSAHTPKVEK